MSRSALTFGAIGAYTLLYLAARGSLPKYLALLGI